MSQIVLHDVDGSILERLTKMAEASGLSVEDQAKALLTQAVDRRILTKKDRRASAARIAAMTPREVAQTSSTQLVREDRDR